MREPQPPPEGAVKPPPPPAPPPRFSSALNEQALRRLDRRGQLYLGARYRDRVTGYEGIAVAHLRYLNGCEQGLIKPTVGEDGKMPDGEWVDLGQLDYVDDGVRGTWYEPPAASSFDPFEQARSGPGGDQPDRAPKSYGEGVR